MITDGYLINRDCLFCPNSIRGKELYEDLPIYEYTCKLENKLLDINMLVPHWCPLEKINNEHENSSD